MFRNPIILIFIILLGAGGIFPSGIYATDVEGHFLELEHDIIMTAEGYGATVEEAKKNALRELSQTIIANVKSDFQKSERLENEEFSKKVVSDLAVKSDVLLKGVVYSGEKRIDGQYSIRAVLTEKALKDTIEFLVSKITINLDNMNEVQLKDTLTNSYFLLSVLTSSTDSVTTNRNSLIDKTREIQEGINKRINFGMVVFNIKPADAIPKINNKIYTPFEPIYLPEREYTFEVSKEGYHKATGKFYLSKGDKKTVTAELVPEISQKVNIYLQLEGCEFLRDDIEVALSDLGLSVSDMPRIPIGLEVKLEDTVTAVDEYKKHNLTLFMKLGKGDNTYKKLKSSIKFYTTPETEDSIYKRKSGELARKLITHLFTKVDMSEFTQGIIQPTKKPTIVKEEEEKSPF